MPLIRGNYVGRVVEDQVRKNQSDIEDLTSGTGLIGIKILKVVPTYEDLPLEDSEEFEELEYGDAYGVGEEDEPEKVEYYVKAEANDAIDYPHWFRIGTIKGETGDPVTITMDGTVYTQVDGNITLPAPPVKSVNGKINYVTLRANDIKYDSSASSPTTKEKIESVEATIATKADATDLNDKVDKYYIPNNVYGIDENGNQTILPFSHYYPNAIAQFNNSGRLNSASMQKVTVEQKTGNERLVVTKQNLNEKTGFLADLTTTDKTNLVAAINEVAASGGGGAVDSVNGQTGTVVLTADDINADNAQSIQTNLERIDSRIDTFVEDNIEGSDYISVDEGLSGKYVVELDQTKLDTEVTEDSDNLITSGAVYDGLASKLDNDFDAFVDAGIVVMPDEPQYRDIVFGANDQGWQTWYSLGYGLTTGVIDGHQAIDVRGSTIVGYSPTARSATQITIPNFGAPTKHVRAYLQGVKSNSVTKGNLYITVNSTQSGGTLLADTGAIVVDLPEVIPEKSATTGVDILIDLDINYDYPGINANSGYVQICPADYYGSDPTKIQTYGVSSRFIKGTCGKNTITATSMEGINNFWANYGTSCTTQKYFIFVKF